jgi:hypothetical protein
MGIGTHGLIRSFHIASIRSVFPAGGEPLKNPPLVVEFGGDDPSRHLKAEGRIEGVLVLPEAGQAVRVGGGEEPAEKLSAPAKDVHGDIRTQERGQRLRRHLNGLADDQSFGISNRDFTQNLVPAGGWVASPHLEAIALEMDPAVGLNDASGGHS